MNNLISIGQARLEKCPIQFECVSLNGIDQYLSMFQNNEFIN